MPTWTDIGGFWVSAGGFALAIALAIVAWVQAAGAKGDAKIAKQQADAAKEQARAAEQIAEQARKQTAIAEAAAESARDQASAASAALDWETVPQLEVTAGPSYPSLDVNVEPAREVQTSTWQISNHGKATAIRLVVEMPFDPDGAIHGKQDFARMVGGQSYLLQSFRSSFPSFEEASQDGRPPVVTLKYVTPTGEQRNETKAVRYDPSLD